MARIYVCDRCKTASGSWITTSIAVPAPNFWGKSIDVELCEPCIKALRVLFNKFMENQMENQHD